MHHIKDYFLIGNLQSAALISKGASIDWLCFPYFDSPSIFAKILDTKNGGTFSLVNKEYKIKSRYLRNTAIVEHKVKQDKNSFKLFDFMLPLPVKRCSNFFLIRKVKGITGKNEIKLKFSPHPDYGKHKSKINLKKSRLILKIGKDKLILHLPAQTKIKEHDDGYTIKTKVKKGEEKEFVLEYSKNNAKSKHEKHNFLKETEKFWKEWMKEGTYFDFCKDEIERSMITLKLMQFYPTGAIVAAPTTSLPDDIGSIRNWDYRYVWIRDATFTLYAFHVLKCYEEGERFFEFIKKITHTKKGKNFRINTVYTIWGKEAPEEKFLKNLSGYGNSKPVRIGNNASSQLQLDVYGSLIDAHYFMFTKKKKELKEHKELLLNLARKIENSWKQKDGGIWEMRGGLQNYAYSKVMAWVGIDRIVKMSDTLKLDNDDKNRLQKLSDEIKKWIWENCYSEKEENIFQHDNSKDIDAANFLFVLLQFLDKHDPRTKKIIQNTSRELSKKEVFIYRYLMDDHLKGKDEAFLLCSFWYISALAIIEDVDESEKLFNKLVSHFNKQFLLSEQMEPKTLQYLGNYPQAFSHLGFVMCAHYLHKYKKRKSKSTSDQ